MAPHTPRTVVSVDLKKRPWEQNQPLHNRWHPHIPAVAVVRVEEVFRIEMVDWTGGCVADNDSAQDIKTIDLSTVGFLRIYLGDNHSNSQPWMTELNLVLFITAKLSRFTDV
ncbi:hypothetical protein ACLOJK_024039 [Asimina triloba]